MSESRYAGIPDRAAKIRNWLLWEQRRYEELLSRVAELSYGDAGWDGTPKVHPCECKWEWRVGKLCIMCDNSRWRPVWRWYDRDHKVWVEEEGIDPYALDVSQVKGGWASKSAGDESEAAKRAASQAKSFALLEALLYAERVRDGKEALLTGIERKVDAVWSKPGPLGKIERAVEDLRQRRPELHETLPDGELALTWLALRVRGRIDPCHFE